MSFGEQQATTDNRYDRRACSSRKGFVLVVYYVLVKLEFGSELIFYHI